MDHQPQDQASTTIRAVRTRAERIRQQELARRAGRLRGLDARQLAAVEHLTRRLTDRLLRDPISRGTQLAAGPDGHRHVALLRVLYGLQQEPERGS
jgi:glutamyl-tRNA reductase